jgi:benzoyl-CoA reductase/2-hydroxyglutaryl-CoA dehydratase subunit BcrC/BadD/HgdB
MSERLEEIKKELELDWSDISYVVNQVDVKWLINRVEELELEVSDWRAEVQKWQKFYKESEESHSETKELLKSIVNQNKRYREALKNIYELAEYDEYDNTLEQIVQKLKKHWRGMKIEIRTSKSAATTRPKTSKDHIYP